MPSSIAIDGTTFSGTGTSSPFTVGSVTSANAHDIFIAVANPSGSIGSCTATPWSTNLVIGAATASGFTYAILTTAGAESCVFTGTGSTFTGILAAFSNTVLILLPKLTSSSTGTASAARELLFRPSVAASGSATAATAQSRILRADLLQF